MGRPLTRRLQRRGPISAVSARNAKVSSTREDSTPWPVRVTSSARYIGCAPKRHGSHFFAPGSARRIVTVSSAPPPRCTSRLSRSGSRPDTGTASSTSPSICRPSRLRSRASTSNLPSPPSKLGLTLIQSTAIGPTYSSSTARHSPTGPADAQHDAAGVIRAWKLGSIPHRLPPLVRRQLARDLDRLPAAADADRQALGFAFAERHPHGLPSGELAAAGRALRERHEQGVAQRAYGPSAVEQNRTGFPTSVMNGPICLRSTSASTLPPKPAPMMRAP